MIDASSCPIFNDVTVKTQDQLKALYSLHSPLPPGLGLDEEIDPVEAVTRFLDTLEAEALLHLDTLITDQEAQDRVLLEDVQVTRARLFSVKSVTVC